MMEKKTVYMALAALVGLVFLFRKGNTTPTTIPGFTVGPTTPATTGATGVNPIVIVTNPATGGDAVADRVVTNPIRSTPMPPPVVPSMGFTVGGVTTGAIASENIPPPVSTVTASSQFTDQAEFNEYQRRVQGLGW